MARYESSNPALARSPFGSGTVGFDRPAGIGYADPVEQAYFGPTATSRDTGRMTSEDVVIRTGMTFAVLIATAGLTWWSGLYGLALPALIAGLVLGLFIAIKQITSPVATLSYAAIEGVVLGAITSVLEARYPGIAVQAVGATLAVAAVMLFVYRSGRIRVTPRFTRAVIGATLGYMVLLVVNLVASMFVSGGLGLFQGGPLGIAISLFAVGLASLNLVIDFEMIDQGIRRGVPERFAWYAAFSLTVTLVWLYIEMLRLLQQLRQ